MSNPDLPDAQREGLFLRLNGLWFILVFFYILALTGLWYEDLCTGGECTGGAPICLHPLHWRFERLGTVCEISLVEQAGGYLYAIFMMLVLPLLLGLKAGRWIWARLQGRSDFIFFWLEVCAISLIWVGCLYLRTALVPQI